MRRRTSPALAALLTLLLTLLAPATPAWAHAALLESGPEDGLVLQSAPVDVTLLFSEPVSTTLGAVRVTSPSGERVDDGVPRLEDGGTVVRTGVEVLETGTYVLSWRVTSEDGHPVSGISTFSLRERSEPSAAAEVESSGTAGSLLVAARLVGFVGLVLLVGAVALVLLVWPAGRQQRRVRLLAGTGLALVAVGGAAGFLLQGPNRAGLPLARTLDPVLLSDVAGTAYGQGHLLRLALLPVAALHLVLLLGGRLSPRALRGGALLVGLPLLATWPIAGHAAAGELSGLALPLDALHLLAVGTWTGGVVLLAAALLPRGSASELASALPRWSRVATVSVLVMVGTGLFASWREVRGLEALTQTSYGRLLILKTTLVLLALALGNAARAWVRTHVSRPVAHASVGAPEVASARQRLAAAPLAQLRRTVVAEAVLTAVVLAVTAFLVGTPPARTAYAEPLSVVQELGPDSRVQLDLDTAVVGVNTLHVYLTGPGGKAFDAPEVTARLTRPDGESLSSEIARKSLGHYESTTLAVPYRGTWTLEVQVRTSDVDSATASLTTTFR